MVWFYSKHGEQLGPITPGELSEKLSSGELSAKDLVWKEGMVDWTPLGEVVLFPPLPKPSVSGQMQGSVLKPQPPSLSFAEVQQHVPNYLWQSIVATMFCCMPFGIVAIIYASEVDSHIATGNYTAAQVASKSAKLWVGISVGVFFLFMVASVILFLVGILNLKIF